MVLHSQHCRFVDLRTGIGIIVVVVVLSRAVVGGHVDIEIDRVLLHLFFCSPERHTVIGVGGGHDDELCV